MNTNTHLINYFSLAESIAKQFHPFVEVVIYNLELKEIVAIFNSISKKKIGDVLPSELNINSQETSSNNTDPYFKTNWDGAQLKCTSNIIKGPNDNNIGLICINYDTTFFSEINKTLTTFLNDSTPNNSRKILTEGWKTDIKEYINDYLQKNGLNLNTLSKKKKKELIIKLNEKGIYNYKSSLPYVADIVGVSRATMYNYLKEPTSLNNHI